MPAAPKQTIRLEALTAVRAGLDSYMATLDATDKICEHCHMNKRTNWPEAQRHTEALAIQKKIKRWLAEALTVRATEEPDAVKNL